MFKINNNDVNDTVLMFLLLTLKIYMLLLLTLGMYMFAGTFIDNENTMQISSTCSN